MRRLFCGIGTVVCGAALFTAGVALAGGNPHNATTTTTTTTTNATLPSNAKAYGVYCKNQSKQHVAGQKGTPFSQCVTAMAKLASGQTSSPKAACAALSHRHVAGQKGTPYSLCVAAGAKLLRDRH